MSTLSRAILRRATIEEALEAVGRFALHRAATQAVGIAAAEGRILAQDIAAPEDVPPFARSRVDGFAVVALDVLSASREQPVRLTLAGSIEMGKPPPAALGTGEAMRVPTGGALPPGATGVVMIEDAAAAGGIVAIFAGARCEKNVTPAGGDVKRGEPLFAAGAVLSPAAQGLLAGVGIAEVSVYQRAPVALLITGDELVPPGQRLRPGEIRDINRYAIAGALWAMGFSPHIYSPVPDDRAIFEQTFRDALQTNDAVIISGGSSVGEHDYTPSVVAAAGEPGVIVHGLRAKPGRPTLLGAVGDKPVIGLPGNPVSALVMLEAVGKKILLRLFGKNDDTLPLRAVLDQSIEAEPEIEHRIPVKLRQTSGGLRAQPLLGTSAMMHILGFADALIAMPLGAGRIEAGTIVDAIPFTRTSGLR